MRSSAIRRGCVALAVGASLALAACGDDGGASSGTATVTDGEAAAVRTVVTQFANADVAVCARISDRFLKQTFGGKEGLCVKAAKGSVVNKGTRSIQDVEIDGDKATVVVEDKQSNVINTVGLVKQDGKWTIDSAKVRRAGS